MQSLVQWMQKIIYNSKVYIIHKLGGYTEKDLNIYHYKRNYFSYSKAYDRGIHMLAYELYKLAESLYGKSKQEWIDKIYSAIKANL